MKLSKTLLSAIAIGLTVGALSSCSAINKATGSDLPTLTKGKDGIVCFDDCPGCGMG